MPPGDWPASAFLCLPANLRAAFRTVCRQIFGDDPSTIIRRSPTIANDRQRSPTIANDRQRSPTIANDRQRSPTIAQRFPAAAQRFPTIANDSQRSTLPIQRKSNGLSTQRRLIVFFMTNNSERIRALAPGNAAYFRLKMHLSDGNVRIFPPEDGTYYKVSEPPYHVPVGSYLLCFFDSELRPLIQHDQTFKIQVPTEMARSPQGQLPLNFNLMGPASHGQPSMAAPTYVAPAPAAPSPATTAAAPSPGAPTEPATTEENDLEFRKYLHAMDLEERQQDFIRNSTYVKEVGELFLLNRLMRRDMMEMQRSMVQHAQHAFRDIEQAKTTVHGLIALQNTVLEHVEKRHSSPPTPPPDYVGLGFAAIGLLKEVSVALIQRGQPGRAGQPVLTQPQLPSDGSAPSTAPTPASPPAAETARTADVIDRIGKQLKSLTELELAQAMSSPQAWTALLQRCMAPEAAEGPKEPSQKPEVGPEG